MKSKYSNSEFSKRHIGSNQDQVKAMLKEIGYDSMDEFIEETIPNQIRFKGNLNVGDSVNEYELIHSLKIIASKIADPPTLVNSKIKEIKTKGIDCPINSSITISFASFFL